MNQDARPTLATLEEFYAATLAQKDLRTDSSRMAELLAQDVRKIANKLGEQAVETAVAAVAGTKSDVVAESSDLLFRLVVLWAKVGVDQVKVMSDLIARHGPKTRGF